MNRPSNFRLWEGSDQLPPNMVRALVEGQYAIPLRWRMLSQAFAERNGLGLGCPTIVCQITSR